MDKNNGFRIKSINIGMIAAIAIMCGLVIFTNFTMQNKYNKLEEVQNNYITCVNSSQMMQNSSNFFNRPNYSIC
jgi:hypothetical protein